MSLRQQYTNEYYINRALDLRDKENVAKAEEEDFKIRQEKEREQKRAKIIDIYSTISPVEAFQKNGSGYQLINDDLKQMVEQQKKIVRIDVRNGDTSPITYIYTIYYIDPENPEELKDTTIYKREQMVREYKEDIF